MCGQEGSLCRDAHGAKYDARVIDRTRSGLAMGGARATSVSTGRRMTWRAMWKSRSGALDSAFIPKGRGAAGGSFTRNLSSEREGAAAEV